MIQHPTLTPACPSCSSDDLGGGNKKLPATSAYVDAELAEGGDYVICYRPRGANWIRAGNFTVAVPPPSPGRTPSPNASATPRPGGGESSPAAAARSVSPPPLA